MEPRTISILLDLNRRFYHSFANSFSDTRRRVQPGVRRILDGLPTRGRWLDLGCGNGWLAVEWARTGRDGAYLGFDFSPGLLAEARSTTAPFISEDRRIDFALADLAGDWSAGLAGESFDGLFAFAVLHHLPGAALRAAVLRQVAALLPPGGRFIHSVWQYQHSPRLLARVLPWETAGLSASAVDPGDDLLDWRAPTPGTESAPGLRYVHRFTQAELAGLAAEAGFSVVETFESDGQGGRLGLYQIWQRGPD